MARLVPIAAAVPVSAPINPSTARLLRHASADWSAEAWRPNYFTSFAHMYRATGYASASIAYPICGISSVI